jgi:hypothetical protein
MVNVASCFSQLLSLVDRNVFERLVREHRAEAGAKGFTCWDQFVSMAFCQLAGADSLREICGGLATATGKLVHLGLDSAPCKSTLAYANEHRPWRLYRSVFDHILARCSELAAMKGRKFRFKNPLYSLDASTIELCLKVFDWARFRRAKGAVKLHLLLNHQGYLPCWAMITDGKIHEVNTARLLDLPAGAIVAMDRGYNDYRLFAAWTQAGVFFVTRLKDNAVYKVLEHRQVNGRHILADQTIQFSGVAAREKCSHPLRRVVVWDPEHQREIVLLTNLMRFTAGTVAAIYKERWQIELFFKALKQNLKVKTFVGTSENAVHIQLWTALIAILLLKFMQMKSSFGWSLSNLSAMFRMVLLTYRNLWRWLNEPFGQPPGPLISPQLQLFA